MTSVAQPGPDAPSPSSTPPGERGSIISRGTRVYLRTLTPADLEHLSAWVDDPFIERMQIKDARLIPPDFTDLLEALPWKRL